METPFFVFNHTICSLQLGQIGDDSDATWNASSRGVYRYVEVKGHCMLLSQRSDMPQLQEEGTHPVLCQTRQLSSVRTHLHVCKRKTFVECFSAYSNIRLQNPLLHVSRFQTQICILPQVLRRWYYGGYSWESRSPPELIKNRAGSYCFGSVFF